MCDIRPSLWCFSRIDVMQGLYGCYYLLIMPKRIGIIGGGQLGRMLAQAARKLGFHTTVLDPTPESPAGQVADRQVVGDFTDAEKIYEVARLVDVITFEIESANADALDELVRQGHDINPSPKTLSLIKDKYLQKKFLEESRIPVAASREVISRDDIQAAACEFGYPLLLKARRDAYDGRGNFVVRDESQIDMGIEKLKGRSLYVEKFVPFVKELAVVAVRGKQGEVVIYPVVETIHSNNICHIVLAPAPVDLVVTQKTERLALEIMQHLKGVGVFCIEMFLTEQGEILVNEIAPRVHNSGHYSIEGHQTSQFEQHIRAVTGMPLGSIERRAPASVMINILGERAGPVNVLGLEEVAGMPGVFVHIYGKLETRPERKMGHITVLGDTLIEVRERAERARRLITI